MYAGLSDRLFGARGFWHLKRCSNSSCALMWLDPMPLPEELWKAYEGYYTHTAIDVAHQRSTVKRIREYAKGGYWSWKYGYENAGTSFAAKLLGGAYCLSPIHRRETDAAVRFLRAVRNGRLLDVGCGSGEWLLAMRARGWEVEGVDFDKDAVNAAEQRGLAVQLGSLEDLRYQDNLFDAITLNHVIEHVPDPVRTMRECLRILKPGGQVVLFTPNGASLSHYIFKDSWRGLEPPRHLHIFTPQSMELLLNHAGFRKVCVKPFIVTSVIYDSLLLRRGQAGSQLLQPIWALSGLTRLFKAIELCLLPWNKNIGDCVIALAEKD